MNLANDPTIERVVTPRLTLTAAELTKNSKNTKSLCQERKIVSQPKRLYQLRWMPKMFFFENFRYFAYERDMHVLVILTDMLKKLFFHVLMLRPRLGSSNLFWYWFTHCYIFENKFRSGLPTLMPSVRFPPPVRRWPVVVVTPVWKI